MKKLIASFVIFGLLIQTVAFTAELQTAPPEGEVKPKNIYQPEVIQRISRDVANLAMNQGQSSKIFASKESTDEEQTKESEGKARVKAHIEKYGIGRYQTVVLVLHNKTKWKGYISEVHDDGFVFVHNKDGKHATFVYSQVKGIKSTKLNPGKKFALWSAVVGGAFAFILLAGAVIKED